MDTYRIMRQSDYPSKFDTIWYGDMLPEVETINGACADERVRVNEGIRSPFLQSRVDYLLLQRRRKVIGWKTVSFLNIYEN